MIKREVLRMPGIQGRGKSLKRKAIANIFNKIIKHLSQSKTPFTLEGK